MRALLVEYSSAFNTPFIVPSRWISKFYSLGLSVQVGPQLADQQNTSGKAGPPHLVPLHTRHWIPQGCMPSAVLSAHLRGTTPGEAERQSLFLLR